MSDLLKHFQAVILIFLMIQKTGSEYISDADFMFKNWLFSGSEKVTSAAGNETECVRFYSLENVFHGFTPKIRKEDDDEAFLHTDKMAVCLSCISNFCAWTSCYHPPDDFSASCYNGTYHPNEIVNYSISGCVYFKTNAFKDPCDYLSKCTDVGGRIETCIPIPLKLPCSRKEVYRNVRSQMTAYKNARANIVKGNVQSKSLSSRTIPYNFYIFTTIRVIFEQSLT